MADSGWRARLASSWGREWSNRSSLARDACAADRNALSHLRLTLTLALLSVTFLIDVRIGERRPAHDPPRRRTFISQHDMSVPLGLTFAGLAAVVLLSGAKVHWQSIRSLREGQHAVGMTAFDSIVLGSVALVVLAGVILLIAAH